MYLKLIVVFFIVSCCFQCYTTADEQESYDWVDPFDMVKNVEQVKQQSAQTKVAIDVSLENLDKNKAQLNEICFCDDNHVKSLSKRINELEQEVEEMTVKEVPYFRHFIRKLVKISDERVFLKALKTYYI